MQAAKTSLATREYSLSNPYMLVVSTPRRGAPFWWYFIMGEIKQFVSKLPHIQAAKTSLATREYSLSNPYMLVVSTPRSWTILVILFRKIYILRNILRLIYVRTETKILLNVLSIITLYSSCLISLLIQMTLSLAAQNINWISLNFCSRDQAGQVTVILEIWHDEGICNPIIVILILSFLSQIDKLQISMQIFKHSSFPSPF